MIQLLKSKCNAPMLPVFKWLWDRLTKTVTGRVSQSYSKTKTCCLTHTGLGSNAKTPQNDAANAPRTHRKPHANLQIPIARIR